MKDSKSYGQFCPVARAAEIVASRWTPIVLRELLAGSTKFNDLRNGLPRMSPSLLSKRLIELEDAGIVRKLKAKETKGYTYHITEMGMELAPVVRTLGTWGQKYIINELARRELDPGLLMWDIHRRINVSRILSGNGFIAEFHLVDAPASRRTWWVIIKDGRAELCVDSPGKPISLHVQSGLKALTEVWMGKISIEEATKKKLIKLKGRDEELRSFSQWFSLSVFAESKPVKLHTPTLNQKTLNKRKGE